MGVQHCKGNCCIRRYLLSQLIRTNNAFTAPLNPKTPLVRGKNAGSKNTADSQPSSWLPTILRPGKVKIRSPLPHTRPYESKDKHAASTKPTITFTRINHVRLRNYQFTTFYDGNKHTNVKITLDKNQGRYIGSSCGMLIYKTDEYVAHKYRGRAYKVKNLVIVVDWDTHLSTQNIREISGMKQQLTLRALNSHTLPSKQTYTTVRNRFQCLTNYEIPEVKQPIGLTEISDEPIFIPNEKVIRKTIRTTTKWEKHEPKTKNRGSRSETTQSHYENVAKMWDYKVKDDGIKLRQVYRATAPQFRDNLQALHPVGKHVSMEADKTHPVHSHHLMD